jgi:hypothetical protein
MCHCIQNFNLEWPKGRETLEGLGVNGRIILKWILKELCELDRDETLLSTTWNLWVM